MAFGGCVPDDPDDSGLEKYIFNLEKTLKGEIKYAQQQLDSGPNTGTSPPYWEGYIDALDFVMGILD